MRNAENAKKNDFFEECKNTLPTLTSKGFTFSICDIHFLKSRKVFFANYRLTLIPKHENGNENENKIDIG